MWAWLSAAPIAKREPPTKKAAPATASALRSAEARGVRAGPVAGIESGDRRQVVFGELEVEDVEVLPYPRRGDRLRDHHVAELQVPAQDHLGDGAVVMGGDRHQGVVLQHLTLGERAPGLGDDAVLGVPGAQLG